MKNSSVFSIAAAVAFAAASAVAALAAPAAQPAAPAAKAPPAVIVFLDRSAVLRQSTVGKDISAQVDGLVKKMEAEFAPENNKLQADLQALQSSTSEAPAVRQQKIRDLESRRQAFQKKVQDRQAQIQAGLEQARQKVEQALGPILEKLLVEHGANLMLDRGVVVLGPGDLDISMSAIGGLNAALPKVVVTLARPAAAPGTPGVVPPKPPTPAPGH